MPLPDAPREGDPQPGAAWFRALLDYLRSCRVTVARDGPLRAIPTPDGTVIAFLAGLQPCYAICTTPIGPADATVQKLGRGSAALCRIEVDDAGEAYYPTIGGPDATVYNGHPTKSIEVGQLIQLKVMNNTLQVDVNYCPEEAA